MVMDWMNWLLAAFSTITGATTFITLFMYKNQTKRYKNAEAFEKEVTALKAAVGVLHAELDRQAKRLESAEKQLYSKDAQFKQVLEAKNVVEMKHEKNKGAINKAFSCTLCKDVTLCPVLVQRAKNEEDYLREITNRK